MKKNQEMSLESTLGSSPTAAISVTILATTDLHANLRPYNYYTDQDDPRVGLVQIAPLVEKHRASSPNCLLFDNGDTLQGTPLGDYAVERPDALSLPHPMITAMNALGYDAATPGNHDFNYGLTLLKSVVRQAKFPYLLCNLSYSDESPLFSAHTLLIREMVDSTGAKHALKIGVIGLVPPQVVKWDRPVLADALKARDIVPAAHDAAIELREAGADIIIALCHSGLGSVQDEAGLENAAIPLARSGVVDAVIAGHTHHLYPPGTGQTDPLTDTPIVQPGFFGSHLGVLELELEKRANGWRVTRHSAHNELAAEGPPHAGLMQLSEADHMATLAQTRREIGMAPAPLHSYFTMIETDPMIHLIARAQRDFASAALADQGGPDLPLLSVAAPFKSGGRAGPDYYTEIPAGPLTLRNAADLYLYPNMLQVLQVTGADLKDWLERAACAFNHVQPGQNGAILINRQFSCYNFDVVEGVTYQIDLSKPPIYSAEGDETFPGEGRIINLAFKGRAIRDNDSFLVATNSYRASGGGHFDAPTRSKLILDTRASIRDLVADYITKNSPIMLNLDPVWSFAPLGGTEVIFGTGPAALAYSQDIARLDLRYDSICHNGYARFKLTL